MTSTATTVKPSEAQLDVLRKANSTGYFNDKPIGRLNPHGWSEPTLRILLERGWVYKDQFIRDADERASLMEKQFSRINGAKEQLALECWKGAFTLLKAAMDIQQTLECQAYWLTDSGMTIANEMKPKEK